MKKLFNNIFSAVRDWQRIAGYSNRNIVNKVDGTSLVVVEYQIPLPSRYGLRGKKMLFFSDLHIGSVFPDVDEFRKIVASIAPDWVLFGGDLITYACFQNDAISFLKEILSPVPDAAKVAVYGNWDRRRKHWYPNSRWIDAYNDAGFHLLINESVELGGIKFYGIDEPRIGTPVFDDTLMDEKKFNCVISHSVDPVIDAMPENQFKEKQLFLCGHSHGGQIRLPFFGAFLTSTKYWKLFEYGHYYSQRKNADLIMTSGIGTTRLPFRIFCAPEVVVVKFVEEEGGGIA